MRMFPARPQPPETPVAGPQNFNEPFPIQTQPPFMPGDLLYGFMEDPTQFSGFEGANMF